MHYLMQIVNQRLLQPGVLFDKFLTMKETSKAEYDLKNDVNGEKEPKLKEEYNEDNDQYLRGEEIKGSTNFVMQRRARIRMGTILTTWVIINST